MRCSPKAADSDAGCIGPTLFSFATSSASLHLIYVCIDGSLCQAAARCNDSPDNSPLQLALSMLSAHLRQSLSMVQSEQYTCPPKACCRHLLPHASPMPVLCPCHLGIRVQLCSHALDGYTPGSPSYVLLDPQHVEAGKPQ